MILKLTERTRRAAVALCAVLLILTPALAQNYDSNVLHSSISGTLVTTGCTSAAPCAFPTIDAEDTPYCTASTNVLTNTATAGTNWTMQVQGSANGTTFYPIDLETAATVTTSVIVLASGTGVSAAESFNTGFRYVRVVAWWGTAPSAGGASTCTATISCKKR